jgi:hypothetical protein
MNKIKNIFINGRTAILTQLEPSTEGAKQNTIVGKKYKNYSYVSYWKIFRNLGI